MRAAGVPSFVRRALWTFFVLALFCGLRSSVAAQIRDDTIFNVNGTQNLYTVDPINGATTLVTSALSFTTTGIARDPATGRLYYAHTNDATPARNGSLAYYDPATSTNVTVNATGNGINAFRMAFNGAGVLYASSDTGVLYTVNTATGLFTSRGTIKVTNKGNVTLPSNGDMAFDFDGTLYINANCTAGTGAANTCLYTVDPNTANAVEIGIIVTNQTQGALTFGAGDKLYAGGNTGNMYEINKSTGAVVRTVVTGSAVTFIDFATSPKFADLSITKTASSGFGVGRNATYTLAVRNAGPASASGTITVTDTLPSGLSYVSGTGTNWTCGAAGQVVTCTNAGPLASGNSLANITLTVAVATAAAPSVTNSATVSSPTIDQVSANNSSSVTTPVNNVTLNKSVAVNGAQPQPGTDLTYTITYNNAGGVSAATFIILDTIPANTDFKLNSESHSTPLPASLTGVTIDYFDSSSSAWVTNPTSGGGGAPAGYNRNITQIRWSFSGTLAASSSGSVQFTVRIQ